MLFALTSIEQIDQADAASVPPLGSCQEVHGCTTARAPREPCRIRDSAVLYSRGRVRSSHSHYNRPNLQFLFQLCTIQAIFTITSFPVCLHPQFVVLSCLPIFVARRSLPGPESSVLRVGPSPDRPQLPCPTFSDSNLNNTPNNPTSASDRPARQRPALQN
jgi:hypothetical protein